MNAKERARELAEIIRNKDQWDLEDLSELCELAGLEAEWQAADDENFEPVVFKAAEILQVEVL